jgi:DNA-binding NarL/FixJ family response regulator
MRPEVHMPTETMSIHLTRREHRYLWLLSQGFLQEEIGGALGLSGGGVRNLGHVVRSKLKARTGPHVVIRARDAALIGPRESCGTRDGCRAHRQRNEDPCPACRREHALQAERRYTYGLAGRKITLSERELKILREFEAGTPRDGIAARWEVQRKTVDRVAQSVYLKFDVAHLPVKRRRQEALREARRHGFLPPLTTPDPVDGRVVVRSDRNPVPVRLTDMEREFLLAMCKGVSLAEMSRKTGKSRSCIASRLTRIYRKLGVADLPVDVRREAARDELARREALA